MIIKKVSRLKILGLIGKYAKGRFRELEDLATYLRGTSIEIESGEEMVINLDGEIIRSKKVNFRIIPASLRVLFPRGMKMGENVYKRELSVK